MNDRRNLKTQKAPNPVQKSVGITYQAPIIPLEEELYDEEELNIEMSPGLVSSAVPKKLPNTWLQNNWRTKILILLVVGFLFLAVTYALNESTSTVDGNEIMKEQISSEIAAGTILFNKEESGSLQAKDFEVTGFERGEPAKLLIWDFNEQDSDQVQIFVDGKLLHSSVVLTHRPVAFSVPVPSVVTIKGTYDGGGGITYAIKFSQNNLTYFNVANVNEINTYTLVPGL